MYVHFIQPHFISDCSDFQQIVLPKLTKATNFCGCNILFGNTKVLIDLYLPIHHFLSLIIEKDHNSVLFIYIDFDLISYLYYLCFSTTPYFTNKILHIHMQVFEFQLHSCFPIGVIFKTFFEFIVLKMCNCSFSTGSCNFSTYEWITMVTQILILLVLTLILFNIDEKYIEKHV